VGGGPAGASLAIRLAREGTDVCVVDRSRFPRDKPCGEFLSPGATPILEDLGVREAVETAGARRLERVRIVAHGAAVELDFPDDEGAAPWGYSLSRRAFDAILLDAARAAGARVLEETRVDGVRFERGRVAVSARGGGDEPLEIGARLVVGAGGRNCPVARALGSQRRDARARFDLLAHWSGRPPHLGGDGANGASGPEPVCELRVRGDRYVAVAPIENGRWNVNCVVSRSALRGEPDPGALYREVVRAAASAEAAPIGAAAEAAPVEEVIASDVTPLWTGRATADRALLIGDAALFLDPFTGQGLYLALRSAALAAAVGPRALAMRASRASLAPYEATRAAEFDARRRVSRALQAVLYRPRAARAVIRALGRDRALARTLSAATGDLIPSERVWSPAFALRLLGLSLGGESGLDRSGIPMHSR
jgi:flavin-dependent dehydrogenase